MKLGDAVLLVMFYVMVGIVWVQMGHSWLWIAGGVVGCTALNVIHENSMKRKAYIKALQKMAEINKNKETDND